jgi:hypothetical protein
MLVADDLQPVDIQSIVNQVDSSRLLADLSFVQGIRHRTAGIAHLQDVKDFIHEQFQDKLIGTYLQTWPYGSYAAHNIIGRQIGTDGDGTTYLLGGHFDTVNDAPGADDNGSAVVGMLEVMRVLSQYPSRKSIQYIGFDLEEAGLLGSIQYVQNGIAPGESIAGMIDFEMIGYYSEKPNSQSFPPGFEIIFANVYDEVESQEFKGNFITNVGKQGNSAALMNSYKAASDAYVPELRVINVEAPQAWQALTPDLGRSDHAPFWLSNIPAIMLTDGAEYRNPNYHEPTDVLDSLNFTFMANVVKGTVATLAQLAEVQHADLWWGDTGFFTSTHQPFSCDLTIAPNPANDLLRIEWKACNSPVLRLSLLDATGRVMRQAESPAAPATQLEVADLPKGTYFVKMEGENGAVVKMVVLER